jgi:hypothetical protein
MSAPSLEELPLEELEARRGRLYEQLAGVGDFRRGSVRENYRRCGTATCACARPGHRGHGPYPLWTRSVRGRGTIGRALKPGEVAKVRGEIANYQRFAEISEQIVEVNQVICEARPVEAGKRESAQSTEPEKGGSLGRSGPSSPSRSNG